MSTQSWSGYSKPVPCTNDCQNSADAVVVIDEINPLPRCAKCIDDAVYDGHREYPISAFYEEPGPDATIVLDDWDTVELTQYDDETAWLEASCPTTDYFNLESHR